MDSSPADHDSLVRRQVYAATLALGVPPTIADLCVSTRLPAAEVRNSLQRLAAGDVLVLQHSGEILMAAPYSAVPTGFLVETPRYRAFANCIWDALGIPAMSGESAVIRTACGCCGEQQALTVEGDSVTGDGVIHFAVPAAHWWDDIVFT